MKFKLLTIVLLSFLLVKSQNDRQSKYPFLVLEKNKITYPGDSLPFQHFYKKLDTLFFEGKGQVNIVHMGGSHVQAGTLSNRMRVNMLSLSPDIKNERGFFFPYRLAHTNNPRNYSVSSNGVWEGFRCSVNYHFSDWGASGISATTMDSNIYVSIVAFDEEERYHFNKVRIFYHMDEHAYVPEFNAHYQVTSVHFDSTAHYMEIAFAKYYDTLQFNIKKTDSIQSYFTIQGVQYLTDEASLNYNSIGVNGAATKSYLRCENFQNQLYSINADLVIFGIGINDAYKSKSNFSAAEFRINYDSLVTMFKNVNPNVAFLFLSNNDSYYKRRYPNPNVYKVSEVMQRLCKKHGAGFWDLFEIMGGYNSIKTWQDYGLAKPDKIHFTKEGYILQGDLLFEAIMASYGEYLKEANKTLE